jgi:glycosyltransferase involved in cell wall biosynthesis
MRIGIDCRTILNPEKGGAIGLGHYVYQLVRHLLKIDDKNSYLLFFDRTVEKRRLSKFRKPNVQIKFFPFTQYAKFLSFAYRHYLVSAFLEREKLDIFHAPTLNLPTHYKRPTVVTVHDLAIFKLSEYYLDKTSSLTRSDVHRIIRQANKLIAVSFSTKKDLEEIFNVPTEKVKVIYHGIDERFFRNQTVKEIEAVKKKYCINGDYFLFLGELHFRKNIIRIIEAFERLQDKLTQTTEPKQSFKLKLVLAGRPSRGFSEIQGKIEKSKYKDDFILPGYIAPDDIDALYEGARCFVFPTLYEGFGMPVIEAMANKVPVITSNISSLPEITRGRAILVDPYNVAEITQAMFDVLTNPDRVRELGQLAYEWARNFSWEKCARETLELYQAVAKF